jgi:hypothetical protein
VRRLCLLAAAILALLVSPATAAQDPARKPAAKKKQAAHAKPTPEQVRRFNQLQKKQQGEKR